MILQDQKDLETAAEEFLSEGFPTVKDAITGAIDILVEAIAEDPQLRNLTYQEIRKHSLITSSLKDESKDEKQVFQIYYDFSEKIANMQGYRTLALNRGEKLGVLKVGFEHPVDRLIRHFEARFKSKNGYIEEVISQALKKKMLPAMERRIRTELTEVEEDGAIQLFSENLRHLLLIAPSKGAW